MEIWWSSLPRDGGCELSEVRPKALPPHPRPHHASADVHPLPGLRPENSPDGTFSLSLFSSVRFKGFPSNCAVSSVRPWRPLLPFCGVG